MRGSRSERQSCAIPSTPDMERPPSRFNRSCLSALLGAQNQLGLARQIFLGDRFDARRRRPSRTRCSRSGRGSSARARRPPNNRVRSFANRTLSYLYRITRYLTYNQSKVPFPFSDFPPEVGRRLRRARSTHPETRAAARSAPTDAGPSNPPPPEQAGHADPAAGALARARVARGGSAAREIERDVSRAASAPPAGRRSGRRPGPWPRARR